MIIVKDTIFLCSFFRICKVQAKNFGIEMEVTSGKTGRGSNMITFVTIILAGKEGSVPDSIPDDGK